MWWRHKHHCRERLVSSATHHQPVEPSRGKNVHPGQICKHQFNLHGESYCHQLWQQKPLGHTNAQRVTLLSPISLSNEDIKPLWTSEICHWEVLFSLPVSAAQWIFIGPRETVHVCMPRSSTLTLIADKLLSTFRIRDGILIQFNVLIPHKIFFMLTIMGKAVARKIATLVGQIL